MRMRQVIVCSYVRNRLQLYLISSFVNFDDINGAINEQRTFFDTGTST